jgi:serine-type D-Ala-D-Ala carboxypeptidase (penicillin-binding protein 5/6)
VLVVLLVIGAIVGAGIQLTRTTPAPRTRVNVPAALRTVPEPTTGPLVWPTTGSADMVVPGVVTFPATGSPNPVPIASLTKLMTTLVLLQDYPLSPGQSGPSFQVTDADVADATADVAENAVILPVLKGETLTEAQIVQAMLVVSANNVADMAAEFDAGSVSAFVAKMNQLASSWGLHSTHFDDPSGLATGSQSTASDLLALAQRAFANPLIRADVALTSVILPTAPEVDPTSTTTTTTDPNAPPTTPPDPLAAITNISWANSNTDLGKEGIVGMKTGYDSAAGGCFVFASEVTIGTTTQLAYGVVLGQQPPTAQEAANDDEEQRANDSLQSALSQGLAMAGGLQRVLGGVTLVRAGRVLGSVRAPWGATVSVTAAQSVAVVAPPGTPVGVAVHLFALKAGQPVKAGHIVGRMTLQVGTTVDHVSLVAHRGLAPPSLGWRLTRS